MRRTFFCLVLLIFVVPVFGQQDYFVFIQEPGRQPFYVRIGEKSYSSSSGGHLVLAPLHDSVYNMYVGFPKNRYPEQLFTLTVNRDMGFELRNNGGRWQLFDLQQSNVVPPAVPENKGAEKSKKTDTYSELMAGVVNDTAVLYSNVDTVEAAAAVPARLDTAREVANTPVKAAAKGKKATAPKKVAAADNFVDSTLVVAKSKEGVANTGKDSVVQNIGLDSSNAGNAKETAVAPANAGAVVRDKRDIIRYSTENIAEGTLVIYLDRSGAVTDTIRIVIPRL